LTRHSGEFCGRLIDVVDLGGSAKTESARMLAASFSPFRSKMIPARVELEGLVVLLLGEFL